ncbi:MAG: hypothetical protein KAQ62_13440 [Cyclobacteriaceae bacterium]|nr:hypothetical protein [Cyclobacteriaceae bacterium]
MKDIIFIFSLLLIGFSGCLESTKSNKNRSANYEKPNVVFIICDDLNDYVGTFNGHSQAKTPNIDKLAKSEISFMNAHSNVWFVKGIRN